MTRRAVIPGPYHRRARDLFALLGRLRKERRVTFERLSAALGCSQQQSQKLITGKNTASLAQFIAFCDALGVSAADLLADTPSAAYRHAGVRFAEAYMAINQAGPDADLAQLYDEQMRAHDAFLRAYRARLEAASAKGEGE